MTGLKTKYLYKRERDGDKQIMSDILDFKNSLINGFAAFEKSLNGQSKKLLHAIRKDALSKFEKADFPNLKNEEWRYTNLSPVLKHIFNPLPESSNLTSEDVQKFLFGNTFKYVMVFVNGKFQEKLSSLDNLPGGLIVKSIASAVEENNPVVEKHFGKYAISEGQIFTALSTAYTFNGAFVNVKAGKIIEDPIHLLFITDSGNNKVLTQPRNLFVAEKNSRVSVLEHYVSLNEDVYFTNTVTEVVVEENAFFDHIKLQEESKKAFHISRMEIDQERSSNFTSHAVSLGADISRGDINSKFNDEGSECTLNGLFMIEGTQLSDTHTLIDHAKAHCNSHEHYKGILDDSSRGVFNGKVIVRQDAQKTNAFQQNNNIILSNDALINTKPQLEIFADDVKCSHGATIGQLDEDAMFYLKTRGIGEDIGRGMLLHAFASDVVKTIKLLPVRDYIENILSRKFNQ